MTFRAELLARTVVFALALIFGASCLHAVGFEDGFLIHPSQRAGDLEASIATDGQGNWVAVWPSRNAFVESWTGTRSGRGLHCP